MAWWTTVLDWLFSPDDDDRKPVVSSDAALAVLDEEPPASGDLWWQPAEPTVTQPQRLEAPPQSESDAGVVEAVQKLLHCPETELPHLPHVPQKVLILLRQEQVQYKDVADALSQDQVLSATVLRRANAAALGARVKVSALTDAVTRLGLRGLRSLMITQSLRHLTLAVGTGQSRGDRLWRQSLASGVIAAAYDSCFSVCQEDAFLIGLLHDIGKVAILRACHDAGTAAGAPVSDALFDYLCQEYHEPVGEALARHWELPDELAQMAGSHHRSLSGTDHLENLRALLQLTDASVSLLGYAHQEPYDLLAMPAARYLGAADNAAFLAALPTIPTSVERALNAF
jgi:HD-like signal output (HDOD) protein